MSDDNIPRVKIPSYSDSAASSMALYECDYYYFYALVFHSKGLKISKYKNVCPEWLPWASNLVLMRYSRGGATSGCAVGVRVRVRVRDDWQSAYAPPTAVTVRNKSWPTMRTRKLWTCWQGTLRQNAKLPRKYVGTGTGSCGSAVQSVALLPISATRLWACLLLLSLFFRVISQKYEQIYENFGGGLTYR